jgi:citrate synthase
MPKLDPSVDPEINTPTMSRTWITRAEVLERLAVKPQTLYAYVSRGRIAARPDPEDPRRSLYAVEDVVRLADRSVRTGVRPPPLPGAHASRGEAVIDSSIAAVLDGGLYYRGRCALELAETATLEHAARLLWGGDEDPFLELKPRVDVAFPGASRSRLFASLARRAEEDAAAAGRSERSLRREAASLVSELVDAVSGPGPRLYLHQRLARAWKVDERGAQLIRRALVLSAEGELNTAVLTVRVAASTGASLAGCAMAGLAALSSPRYGGRLAQTAAFLAETRPGADARTAARQRLAQGLELPGFGDAAFPRGDPRAQALIEAAGLPQHLLDIVRVGEGLTGEPVNFDMALALVGRRLDLPKDGPFTLNALGRTCGWLAHAMEQVLTGAPVRARLRYIGPEPEFG